MNSETKNMLKKLAIVAVPIMIQNGITNFVSLLDNLMIGRVGTNPMSGVAIVNQILMIWILSVFGGMSGIGIFISQFYGKKDNEGIRYMIRLETLMSIFLVVIGFVVLFFFKDPLIRFYLKGEGSPADVAETFECARKYLMVMLLEMIPMVITQTYSTLLRGVGNTVIPMKASITAVFVNLVGNYILIFGKFGAPALGVVGAAVATVLARIVEMSYIVIWTHRHTAENPYMIGVYRSLHVPGDLVRTVIKKSFPLLANEMLWAGGEAAAALIYSLRGLNVIAAYNICSTVSNVFSVCLIGFGSAIGIVLGQQLGAGKKEGIIRRANICSLFSVAICVGVGTVLFLCSTLFPTLYNTTEDVRYLASGFIRVLACVMPMHAYLNATYFTIRCGGRTGITFLFDAGFSWAVYIPVALVLVKFTALPAISLFLSVKLLDLIKCGVGTFLVQKGSWIIDLTEYGE